MYSEPEPYTPGKFVPGIYQCPVCKKLMKFTLSEDRKEIIISPVEDIKGGITMEDTAKQNDIQELFDGLHAGIGNSKDCQEMLRQHREGVFMEDKAKYEVDCPQCKAKDKRIQELEEALSKALGYKEDIVSKPVIKEGTP
jgi:phage FluMu protein Com